MSQPQAQSAPQQYEPAQIVVGLEHRNLLESQLTALQIAHRRVKSSPVLGLALLKLDAVAAAARASMAAAELLPTPEDRSSVPPAPTSGSSLDQVLWALRRVFKARYAGWTPTLGKNRLVGHVQGVGEVIFSGGGEPRALDPTPARELRAIGPGAGIRVGVLDTAFYPQPWLAGGWTARFSDMLSSQPVPPAAEGHATFVTGLILSQAPGATVEVRRVLNGKGQAESWDVAEELVRFGQSGLDVLNLSFACYTEDGEPPLVLATAIDRLDPRLVVVAAAGNADASNPHRNQPAWPAALDDVIAVGAATEAGELADFSPDAPWIDVHARGVDLTSTYLDAAVTEKGPVQFHGWAQWKGSSFAAALVTGAVARGASPNRISGTESARDIMRALRINNNLKTLGNTHAKFLDLPIW
jgi:membrane-anchored mycosin MYCP